MFSRHDPSDDHWDRLRHLLPGQSGGHGGAGSDTHLFVDVIRHLATTGIAWADRPASAGKPNRLWPRYRRRGERERIAAAFWKLLVNTIRDAREIGFGAKGESPSPG